MLNLQFKKKYLFFLKIIKKRLSLPRSNYEIKVFFKKNTDMNRFSDKYSSAPAGISSGRKSVFNTPPPPPLPAVNQ
jgi:hypothetical protein